MAIGRDQAAALLGSLSALIRASRAVAHRSAGEMGAAGTPVGLLKSLSAGDSRPGDLAAALHVAPSVVSRAIVPLESAGLVERTTDPADRRAALIGLTALGRERLASLQDAYVEQVSQVLDGWTDTEAEQAAQLLTRLEQALSRVVAPEAHRRLLGSTLIPGLEPPAPEPPAPEPPAPEPPAPDALDPYTADTDVDTQPVISTRKPVPA